MDMEIYQLIQQVAEIARQAAIDKAAADVVELGVIGEWADWAKQSRKSAMRGTRRIIEHLQQVLEQTPTKRS